MKGYDDTSYGSAFADVYDDWYLGISDIEATIADLRELAGTGPVLELGVGTGRLAVPLAYHDTSDDTRDDTSGAPRARAARCRTPRTLRVDSRGRRRE